MIRWFSLVALLVLCGSISADDKKEADEKGSVKPKVVSLSIRKPLPAKPGEFAFMSAGTTLDVVVFQPDKFIVGIDPKASKLDHFTDDKKTDLHKGKGLFTQTNWINEFMTRTSADGDNVTIQINGVNAPAKGAEKILFKGSLVLQCGASEKATDKKELTLKNNEEIALGKFKVKVNFTGPFGSNLAVLADEATVKSAEFFDAQGKAIKPTSSNRSAFPTGLGKNQHTLGYALNGKHEKLSVKITYFEKVESVTVPLDLKVGLDLE